MSFNSNNNNDRQPVNVTYSPVTFSNPESAICKSKLSISYFNKLLKIGIALRKNEGSNDAYATYDMENQTEVYVSYTKAKILHDLIEQMKTDDSIHNVCIELKGGLLVISDGSELGSDSPCITIHTMDGSGNVSSVIYQTKSNYHKGAYNYSTDSGSYEDQYFNDIELDSFQNVLHEYYNAATYAVAATVMEASMYKRNAMNERIYAIAEKVGAVTHNNGGGYSNKSQFLNNNNSSNDNSSMDIPNGYERSSFDDIANS